MNVDPSKSEYEEDPEGRGAFSRAEQRRLRLLLRRLRFLEAQINKRGGLSDGAAGGGAAFAEMEVEALEFVLTDIGFIRRKKKGN